MLQISQCRPQLCLYLIQLQNISIGSVVVIQKIIILLPPPKQLSLIKGEIVPLVQISKQHHYLPLFKDLLSLPVIIWKQKSVMLSIVILVFRLLRSVLIILVILCKNIRLFILLAPLLPLCLAQWPQSLFSGDLISILIQGLLLAILMRQSRNRPYKIDQWGGIN